MDSLEKNETTRRMNARKEALVELLKVIGQYLEISPLICCDDFQR